ncbi:hypothetical protein CR513_23987, partial [Mucuna pruriens]
MLPGLNNAELEKCSHCMTGKQTRVSFKKHPPSGESELLELVHSNICGPLKVKSFSGALYFVTFIDDCSRKLWVYMLKTKDQVLEKFKEFQALVERESGKKLKYIRFDNGGEYCGPFDNGEQHNYVGDQQLGDDFDVPLDDDAEEEQEISQDENLGDAPELPPVQLRMSNRYRQSSTRYTSNEYMTLTHGEEPECYQESMESEERQKAWQSSMLLCPLPRKSQSADLMTKVVQRGKFEACCEIVRLTITST